MMCPVREGIGSVVTIVRTRRVRKTSEKASKNNAVHTLEQKQCARAPSQGFGGAPRYGREKNTKMHK